MALKKRFIIIIVCVAAVVLVASISIIISKFSGSIQASETNKTSASELLKVAQGLEDKQDLVSAKEKYATFILDYPNDPKISEAQEKLEDLNIRLIFSPILTPDSFIYEVEPNDTLTKIAKENNTTVALIKTSNDLESDTIRTGMRLKILRAKFNVFIDKSQNVLVLKNDEEVIKNYIVSTGKNNSTPIGTFKIVNKIENPVWFKEGAVVPPESKENILGSRWMGLDLKGYGIHGTTEPEMLGQQITQGCVRMRNQEVEELFDILLVGTEIVIED